MSSYEKVVKLACKPKAAPPKAKYLDPIVAATWSDDGAVHDVCKALSPRLREPNSVIVFKALIVLHTMIRNGSTDNVLSYLASSDVLRLKNVTDAPWEGYAAPENLKNYAMYMETRIKAYANLKHDAIRVQSESNRDHQAGNEDGWNRAGSSRGNSAVNGGVSRSKTMAGRKLRQMSVEKGLLRETKIVQKQVTALLNCKFFLDNLEDELVTTALQLLVKDLLVLFQAINEGVINVLEHYFEMSHVDATTALEIYRHFCDQTKDVVEFLAIAKKLHNLLGIPIPNLKHAPVSLAGALQEYLNDPNFEQNRIEYRANKAIADGRAPPPKVTKTEQKSTVNPANADKFSTASPSTNNRPKTEPNATPSVTDFFTSIEQEQSTIFNPHTNSPSLSYFHQQATSNPFTPFQTGMPTGVNQFGQQVLTGPFNTLPPQATGAPFLQPQPTGFLQPQATGFNPFRQSVLLPQATGFPSFASASVNAFGNSLPSNPFQSSQPLLPPPASTAQSASNPTFPLSANVPPTGVPPPIPRPQSTPILSSNDHLKPVVSHQTGSRNPFGIPRAASPPPVPKMPTLHELSGGLAPGAPPQQLSSVSPSHNPSISFSGMSSVASAFTGIQNGTNSPPQRPSSPQISHTPTLSLSSNPSSIILPQPTGFSGITPFKPTSSFGASLLETLPPISGPSELPSRPLSPTRQLSSHTTTNSTVSTPFGSLSSKSTLAPISESEVSTHFPHPAAPLNASSTLRPLVAQMTGSPNPFRASMIDPSTSLQPQVTGLSTFPFSKPTVTPFQPQSSFGQHMISSPSNSAVSPSLQASGHQPPSNNPLISFT